MLIRQQIDKIIGKVVGDEDKKGKHTRGVLYLSVLLTSSYFYNKLVGRGLQSFRMQQARNIFIATISCLRSNTKAADLLRHFKNQLRMIKMRQARLDPEAVLKKYQTLALKYQRGNLPPRPRGWHENERRLFLWFLFAYYHLNYKKYSEITSKEWREFSECFGGKDVLLLRYEAVVLQKNSQRVSWLPPEEALLRDLFKSSVNGKWGDISKGLFFRSEGQYYKTSKQCREHWFNHLNNDIRKGGWTIEEDIAILTFVRNEGRHWSRLIDQIGRVRTEHMAKNRFGSLITLGRKYCNTVSEVNQNEQNILISSLIEYLSTHKALIYDNNSPSSPELQCKSDKSISVECAEMKEEAEQAQGKSERVISKNRSTMLDISDVLDNNQAPSFEVINSQHYNIRRQNNEDVNPKEKPPKQQEQLTGFKNKADNNHRELFRQNQGSQNRLTLAQQNQITGQQVLSQASLLQNGGANEVQGDAPFNPSSILYPMNPFSFTFNTIQINPPNMQVLQPFAVFNYVIPYVPLPQERHEERE